MIKGSINQDDIVILNIYVPSTRALKYMKQKLMNFKVKKLTITVRDFNFPLSKIDT